MTNPLLFLRQDTIAAVSTPQGRGAVAIIRISGGDALDICKSIFRPSGKSNLDSPRTMCHGTIIDPADKTIIDDTLCVAFPTPHSYTGENMTEIHCHGSEAVIRKILEILYRLNARPAEPGEFTFRAVRHGKMDVAQAEGLSALIDSRSQLARALSLRMLEGEFSRDLAKMKDALIAALVEVETQIEFPDDAMEEQLGTELQTKIDHLVHLMKDLQSRSVREQRFEQGILVVLAGRPNVGKSSLFNRLLGRDRAIVTPHAGTTRDSIEGTIELNGRPVTLIDTAGLRETYEEIEAIGVERSRELLTTSHIIIFIFDAETGPLMEDYNLLHDITQHSRETDIILTANKRDLCSDDNRFDEVKRKYDKCNFITASAQEENGLDELLKTLENKVNALVPAQLDSSYLITTRQERLLQQSAESFLQTQQFAQNKSPLELIAEELRSALKSLSELDGSETPPDIINTIFSRFCIGK